MAIGVIMTRGRACRRYGSVAEMARGTGVSWHRCKAAMKTGSLGGWAVKKAEKIEKPAVTQKAGDPEKAPSAPVVMRISPWGEADLFPCARLCAREMEMKVDALRKLIRNGDADSFGYTYDYALEVF